MKNEEQTLSSTQECREWLGERYRFDFEAGVFKPSEHKAFLYSDGDDVEDRLAGIMHSAFDRSSESMELVKSISDWPTNYHLNPRRANLLRPLRHMLKGKILEIGAGTGAITRFLGENGGEIVAVEGSARRGGIAASRCADLTNVNVVCDDFAAFPSGMQFDVVTLIGVLEYARRFFKVADGDAINALIARARHFLRPGGVLIVAIENQLGLKYFAGCKEDHFGQAMVGIEDRYGADTPVTFGRKELSQRLAGGGLPHQQWWFPFPDYKLPVSLLSDQILQHDVDFSEFLSETVRSDPQLVSPLTFSLENAWYPVYRNGLAADLANSFLIVSSDQPLVDHATLAVHYGHPRRREFNKEIRFEWKNGNVQVQRQRLHPQLTSVQSNFVTLHLEDEPFLKGRNWHKELVDLFAKDGWTLEHWAAWARTWFDALLVYGGLPISPVPGPDALIPPSLMDAVPRNLVFDHNNNPVFFDQEWCLDEAISLGFAVYRGIFVSLGSVIDCARPEVGVTTSRMKLFRYFISTLGWDLTDEDLRNYAHFEGRIQCAVTLAEPPDLTPSHLSGLYASIPLRCHFNDLQPHAMRETEARYQTEIHHLKNELAERNAHVAQLEARYQTEIHHLKNELAERNAHVAQLEARHHEETHRLQGHARTLSTDIEHLWGVLAAAEAKLVDTEKKNLQQLAERNCQIARLYVEISRVHNAIAEIRHEHHLRVQGLEHAIAERDVFIADLARRLKALQTSLSWRLTSGMRWIVKKTGKILKGRSSRAKSMGKVPENAQSAEPIAPSPVPSETDPGILFDRFYYLHQNPDVEGSDPWEHYVRIGAKKGLKPNPFFDTAWYLDQYVDVAGSGVNPLLHYLECGAAEGRQPGPDFDGNWYSENYADVSTAGENPLRHYLTHGHVEGRTIRPIPVVENHEAGEGGTSQ